MNHASSDMGDASSLTDVSETALMTLRRSANQLLATE
jgi:hypothetical protein